MSLNDALMSDAPTDPILVTSSCDSLAAGAAVTSATRFTQSSGKHCQKTCVTWQAVNGLMQVTVDNDVDEDPLLMAVWRGDARVMRDILMTSESNQLQVNKDGWTPLHEAAYYGQAECMKILLLVAPQMINHQTTSSQTPLILAAARGHFACTQCLLDMGADPNIADKSKRTPIYEASVVGNVEMVQRILRSGARVDRRCAGGWTALHEAASRNNLSVTALLVEHGAKVDAVSDDGISPLFIAAQSGSVDTLLFLIKSGAEIAKEAKDGATSLFEACRHGHNKIVEILLSHGADPNKPEKRGLLPLHVAAKRGYCSIVSLLIPVTSSVKLQHSGISPLHLAAENDEDDTLEMLIEAGFDANSQLSSDWSCMYEDRRTTPLYFAVVNSNLNAAGMLLEAGAGPNLDTFNPLLVAVKQGYVNMVSLLLKHGAHINANVPTQSTSFPAAVLLSGTNLAVLKCLMDYGCDAMSCFQCSCGKRPYKATHVLQFTVQTGISSCLQFCEMLSRPTISHWAGPVIDVLLDYVGQTKLCDRLIEHLDSYGGWIHIKMKATLPRPLMHLCRLKIRQLVGVRRLERLKTLNLPGKITAYLNYAESYIQRWVPDTPSSTRFFRPNACTDRLFQPPRIFMAAASISTPVSTGSCQEFEDYSAYSKLSDEQLIQLAIERSLADAEKTTCLSPPDLSARRGFAHQHNTIPPSANPPQPPITSSNRSRCCGLEHPSASSETQEQKISRDSQSHFFRPEKEQVVAWTRHNGFLHVTVEAAKDLDPLLSAVWKGDAEALSQFIRKESPKNVNKPNKDGWIPLHNAAYCGHLECLKVLLHAYPDTINRRTNRNQTPIILAVARKHLSIVKYLLMKGADPNISNNVGETALYKACEKSAEEVVEVLLSCGANVSRSSIQGVTPLHEAVKNHNVAISKLLIQAGAKIFAETIYGIEPIFMAAQSGGTEVLKILIKVGANINSQANDGATALYEASKNGHEEVVALLLSNKADVNRTNKAGLTALHIAAKNGHVRIVSMLIPRTSRTVIRRSGISPLHLAAERNRDEVLEVLIESGFDVNATLSLEWSKMYEDRRSTALYFAVRNSNLEAVEMLLDAGANPNMDFFKPLLVAVRKGNMEMVTLLVEHGANVNVYIPTHPTTFPGALMFCMNYLAMFKYLMKNGCDANACFDCVHGTGLHPPVNTIVSRRHDLNCTLEMPPETVQFCEMIADPRFSPRAGPIIDLILDYASHVKLCSRLIDHLRGFKEFPHIKEKSTPPYTLMRLCRLKIRMQIGTPLLRISCLPLPPILIRYLNYDDMELEDVYSFLR
ncbi:uncharacterized protein LOC114763708 [Denticeps clupeoides]|uniref:uncharacterized protein LOC114763708 n=1 Tax=Denticeps clupeoides TaxID=299321 RepID=UPI0010A45E0D|nr:uncharacterized protein LOC114763708 [Denticeps clupeoides]